MSMAVCKDCGAFIDTDDDPESTYFALGFKCESCRENMTEAEQEEHERIMNA